MKTKLTLSAITALTISSVCFAANPFVDVPADSWAYKSAVELADAGIIQGVDGQYFQGERNITRYEAAEMVAKAMAHQDKATVEQRALINKLADEYADELNNLGVRVSALEGKVGNVKLSGDARMRYRYQKGAKENDDSWDYRVRLRADAQVNANTHVSYGISTNDVAFSNSTAASSSSVNPYTDKAEIVSTWGPVTTSIGRTNAYVLGNAYGYNYGDAFDRAEVKYKTDTLALTAGYGKFKEAGANDIKTGYGELEGFIGNGSSLGVYYNAFNGPASYAGHFNDLDSLWGAYASIALSAKWNLLGNYESVKHNDTYKNINGDSSSAVWIGKLTYGTADMRTPKTWDAWVEYLNADDGAAFGSSNSWRFGKMDNITSWGVGFDYTFAKNAQISLSQTFGTSLKDGPDADPEEQSLVQLAFAF